MSNPKEFNEKLKAFSASIDSSASEEVLMHENEQANVLDRNVMASNLAAESDRAYRGIATDIVKQSAEQLKTQNRSKNRLKNTFTIFFIVFVAVQYLVLIGILACQGFIGDFLREDIIITYVTSVFVESLGAIVIMVKYAFDSEQEVNILKILNGVIENFQKFDK